MRILVFLLLAATGFAQNEPVTTDSLTARPTTRRGLEKIVWAPDGKSFAYIADSHVWRYDLASEQKKDLVNLSDLRAKAVPVAPEETFDWQNRRVSEQKLEWSSSSNDMLISTGGDLFLLHLSSGSWDQLTATRAAERDPKLSPDGRYVSFRRNHDLYCLDIASRKVNRLTTSGSAKLWNAELDWVYPEELYLSTAHWWSPDSSHIAYLQFDVSREHEFPQVSLLQPSAKIEPELFPQPGTPNAEVRVGVVAPTGGPTRWMKLGDPRDHLLARVYWSPNSQSLAVERLNRVQNRLDLKLADVRTGDAHVILHEEDPYWINVNDLFHFLKDGKRFLWGSERDGFLHVYLYSTKGREIVKLTSGQWEVTALVGVDETARQVYYVSTEVNPTERQLFRVGFDGHNKQRLTTDPGTHKISMSPTCQAYMDTASSLTVPTNRTLNRPDGTRIAVYHKSDPVKYRMLPTDIVRVKARDGALLYARLIKPAGFRPGKKYPAVVMVYGGPGVQTVSNSWTGPNWDQLLAQRGFVIWQLDNRGSSGRGHHWESKVYHNLGEQELRDQVDGVHYLESLGFVDSTRLGIYGWSYGGFMTLYSLCNAPKLFRAGIAGAPVTDWRNYDTIYTERYMGLPDENAQGYARSSPLGKASELQAKLLLIHNIEDNNVHFQNTMQMANALEHAGRHFFMLVYPERSHGVNGTVRRHLLETTTEFFEKTLEKQSSTNSISAALPTGSTVTASGDPASRRPPSRR